jgi:hypothetical protein
MFGTPTLLAFTNRAGSFYSSVGGEARELSVKHETWRPTGVPHTSDRLTLPLVSKGRLAMVAFGFRSPNRTADLIAGVAAMNEVAEWLADPCGPSLQIWCALAQRRPSPTSTPRQQQALRIRGARKHSSHRLHPQACFFIIRPEGCISF